MERLWELAALKSRVQRNDVWPGGWAAMCRVPYCHDEIGYSELAVDVIMHYCIAFLVMLAGETERGNSPPLRPSQAPCVESCGCVDWAKYIDILDTAGDTNSAPVGLLSTTAGTST